MAEQTAPPQMAAAKDDYREGMEHLETRLSKLVTLYLPLGIILVVLLFPFYWMALTSIKPDQELINLEGTNPLWTWSPTLKHIQVLLFETAYPTWLWNTMSVAIGSTILR